MTDYPGSCLDCNLRGRRRAQARRGPGERRRVPVRADASYQSESTESPLVPSFGRGVRGNFRSGAAVACVVQKRVQFWARFA
eukprot:3266297-Prymnesium_polylepis.1